MTRRKNIPRELRTVEGGKARKATPKPRPKSECLSAIARFLARQTIKEQYPDSG